MFIQDVLCVITWVCIGYRRVVRPTCDFVWHLCGSTSTTLDTGSPVFQVGFTLAGRTLVLPALRKLSTQVGNSGNSATRFAPVILGGQPAGWVSKAGPVITLACPS